MRRPGPVKKGKRGRLTVPPVSQSLQMGVKIAVELNVTY